MSKENTSNCKRKHGCGKRESSDSDDVDETPNEVFRKVLSENVISPIKTPNKSLSPGLRNSSPASPGAIKGNDSRPTSCESSSSKRRSTSPLKSTKTVSKDDLVFNKISEEIITTTTPTDKVKIYDSTTVESIPLEANNSEALHFSTTSAKNNPSESLNFVDPLQSTSSGYFQDSPLVFVAMTHFEEEMPLNPVENESADLADDVLISDSSIQDSPKQVPTSAESEDSENENVSLGSFQFENVTSSREFPTPVELMFEIRSVFMLISNYVDSEINMHRTKMETLQINLSRRRRFLGSQSSQPSRDFPTNFQRLASHLMSTMTEQEGLQDTYQGPSQKLSQMSISVATQESSRSFSYEHYGASFQASYGGLAEEYSDQSSGRFSQSTAGSNGSTRSARGCTQASRGSTQASRGSTQTSRGSTQSSRGSTQSSRGSTQSSRGSTQASRGSTQASRGSSQASRGSTQPSGGPAEPSERPISGGLSIESSGESRRPTVEFAHESNSTMPDGAPLFFGQGFSVGLKIGSESYTDTISGHSLQSRLSAMIQQHPLEFPQHLLNLASELIFLRYPRTTRWLNELIPEEFRRVYYSGVFQGFTRTYSGCPSNSINTQLSSGAAQNDSPEFVHGQSRVFFRSSRDIPPGHFRGFSRRPCRSFLQRYLLSFSRRPQRTSQGTHRRSHSGPPPRALENDKLSDEQRPNQESHGASTLNSNSYRLAKTSSGVSTQSLGVSTQSLGGSTQSLGGSTQSLVGSTQSLGGSTQSLGGSTQSLGGSTQSVRGSAQSVRGSAPSVRGSAQYSIGSTQYSIGSTQSSIGSIQSVRGSTQSLRGSTQSLRGSTQSSRGSTQSSIGSTQAFEGPTQALGGSTHTPGRFAFNFDERIHHLLSQSVHDLNMIRALADLILKEYGNMADNSFENISNYLLCFEIMREDYAERENCFHVLGRQLLSDVEHRRREAFGILHLQTLNDILENGISRVQYGSLLIEMHENLSEIRSVSSNIRQLARRAMSYEFWTKEK